MALLDNERQVGSSDSQRGSRLGPEFTDTDIRAFLDQRGAPYKELDPANGLYTKVVDLLVDPSNGVVIRKTRSRRKLRN